jgi:hypothetical protein
VNAATIPARQLALLLADSAAGIAADTAATGLLIRHGYFLHQPGFRRIITAGSSIYSGEPVTVIRWKAAIHALDTGRLPCPASHDAVLRIAASLGDYDIPVHLRDVLAGLDTSTTALVTGAITTASG